MLKSYKVFNYYTIFYRYAGWRLPFLILLILGAGLLELVGIMTLLPLFQVALGESLNNPISEIVATGLNKLGVDASFANLVFLIAAIFIAKGALVFMHSYLTVRTVTMVRKAVQTSLVTGLENASYSFFLKQKTGYLSNLLSVETGRFSASLRTFAQVFVTSIYILIYLPTIVVFDTEMALVTIAVGALAILLVRPLISRTKKLSITVSNEAAGLSSQMIEFVQAFPYLKATANVDKARRHIMRHVNQLVDLHMRIGIRTATLSGFKEPIAVTALLGYLFYKVELLGGSLSAVAVVALLLYRVLGHILELPVSIQRLNQLIGGVHFVADFAQQIENSAEKDGFQSIKNISGDLVLSNVTFHHGSVPILKDISMRIEPHKTSGIVGASGSGKTTLFHVLTGLLNPTSGNISINGQNYRSLSFRSLRRLFGYVPQEPLIFNDTVANNLSLWGTGADKINEQNKIKAAADAANCSTFIDLFPEGYETLVGERGTRLSGGQRQRIAIARELYRDPEILIFDEATSALDSAAESIIQKSIEQLHGKRTVIVIAHRLSTIRNCDRIYVMEDGKIAEHGSVTELFNKTDSHFRRMGVEQDITI